MGLDDDIALGNSWVRDVAEGKGAPALQLAPDSALVAVMRRDAALAADFARRFSVPRHYSSVDALLPIHMWMPCI
jgi:predicted dehydrogenase